ncbi:lasso peptide biosynthesis B2 protein [Streptomyces sp. 8K308]|nr:lasso peptide biosynthesis B2 protein [Streptomyces sp. 8K308]
MRSAHRRAPLGVVAGGGLDQELLRRRHECGSWPAPTRPVEHFPGPSGRTASHHRSAPQPARTRSLASALLCRLRGTWPTWCSGARTPPFAAHAWIEAEGSPVGEPRDTTTHPPLIRVPPRQRPRP